MTTCPEAARELAIAVDGVDWDAGRVSAACDAVLATSRAASDAVRDEALAILVERIARSQPSDGDGVAFAAITCGSLVEDGADPSPLSAVLLAKLPEVLEAARRFADRCIPDVPRTDDEEEPYDEATHDAALTSVDGVPIPRDIFRSHLPEDRGGGVSLAYLTQWVLPAVAAWTRDRGALGRAVADDELRRRAETMTKSDAHWIAKLLSVQLAQPWRVLCPLDERGFMVTVDGIVSNFDLHTLLAAALAEQGIGEPANPPELLDFLRGRRPDCPVSHVSGSLNLYDVGAAAFDLSNGSAVPTHTWVWNEGRPTDVPEWEGSRTVLVGPAAYQRTWSAGRVFDALRADVTIDRELASEEVTRMLGRLRDEA